MAKQLGIIQFKGKLGDIVGAKRAAGQKANTMRVRVREIANPKTTAQIQQRMRLLPAVNFYRMLQNVLNHAFQGTAYKAPSYNEFIKLALKNDNFPYVVKGETLPVPGMYQISKGSLPSLTVRSISDTGVVFDLGYDSRWEQGEATIGDVSKQWINEGRPIQNGDQLTFVIVSQDDGTIYGSQIFYNTAAFIVNTESTAKLSDWLSANGLEMAESNSLTCIRRNQNIESYASAGAVIVSRPPSSAGGAWMRSNTVLTVSNAVLKETRSTEAYELAFDSYGEGAKVLSSDWYLNQSRARYKSASTYIFSGVFQENANRPFLANAMFVNKAGVPLLVVSENVGEQGNIYMFDGEEARMTTVVLDAAQTNAITIKEVISMFPDLIINDTTYDPGTDGGSDDDGDDEVPQP